MLVRKCYVIFTATVRPSAPALPLAGDEEQREAEYLEALLLQEIVSEVSVKEIETCFSYN
jgi:hypothetical protein